MGCGEDTLLTVWNVMLNVYEYVVRYSFVCLNVSVTQYSDYGRNVQHVVGHLSVCITFVIFSIRVHCAPCPTGSEFEHLLGRLP